MDTAYAADVAADIDPEVWVTRARAAELLGVSRESVDRYRRQGLLRSYRERVTGRARYRRTDVEKLRQERGEPVPNPPKTEDEKQ